MTPTGRRRTEPAPIRRILLVRPRRIGDIVLTTPAVAAVRAAFPEARITYLVESPYARLVSGNPIIDEVISVEPHQGLIAFLRLAARLRRERFDAAIDFHGGPRAARLTRLSGARIRVGYEIPGRRFDYHVRVPRGAAGAPVHSVVNHVNLVRALAQVAGAGPQAHGSLPSDSLPGARRSGIDVPPSGQNGRGAGTDSGSLRSGAMETGLEGQAAAPSNELHGEYPNWIASEHQPSEEAAGSADSERWSGAMPALSLPEATEAEKKRVTRFFQEHGVESAKLVVMHVGAGNRYRDWGEANWTELVVRLAGTPDVRVILVGGREDQARAAAMVERAALLLKKPGLPDPAVPGPAMDEDRPATAIQRPLATVSREAAKDTDSAGSDRIGVTLGAGDSAALRGKAMPPAAHHVKGYERIEDSTGLAEADPIIDGTGIFNLIELRELIARARLFVGPDSGPMHIAASSATPIVAIFGPTLPAHFAPWRREAVRIFESRVPCRPCRQRRCDRDYECLRSTTAAEVFMACAEFLGKA